MTPLDFTTIEKKGGNECDLHFVISLIKNLNRLKDMAGSLVQNTDDRRFECIKSP